MSRRLSSRLRDRGMILRASVAAVVEQLESRQMLSAAVVANPGGAPNGPFNLNLAAPLPTRVDIAFVDNADNETGFVIERAIQPTSGMDPLLQFSPIAALPPSAGSVHEVDYSDPTVAPNTTYYYQVHAVNGAYSSSLAGPQAITTPADNSGVGGGGTGSPNPGGPPNGPYHIDVISQSGTPQISFIDNATNETNLFIQRAASAGGPWLNAAVLPPSPGSGQTVIFLDTAAGAPGSTVFYRAYAVNGPYQSSIAGPVRFIIPSDGSTFTGVPNGPYNLTVAATSSTTAQVRFTNNADNESRFVIERSTDAGFTNSSATDLPLVAAVGQQVTFNDTGLTGNTAYFYRVFAANNAQISGPSGTFDILTPLAATTAHYGLDPTFGGGGLAGDTTPQLPLVDIGLGVQPDGGIIVGAEQGLSFQLKRYNAIGELDDNFGSGGALTTGLSSGTTAKNVAIQPDGKIVIAGYNIFDKNATQSVITVRYTAAGVPDPTFGTGGVVHTVVTSSSTPSLSDISVALTSDGRVVVGGVAVGPFGLGGSLFAVRLGDTGIPDASFGNQGVAVASAPDVNNPGTGPFAVPVLHDVAAGPAGQVVLVGEIGTSQTVPFVRAFDPNGNLSAGPFPNALPAATSATVTAAAIQSDGKIVIAGTANGNDGYVARYTAAGLLDPTFGKGGVVDFASDPSLYLTSPNDLHLDADGKILLGGIGRNPTAPRAFGDPSSPTSNFYLARLNTNGTFDTAFSPTGVISTSAGGGPIDAIALAPGGGIVAVGDGGTLLARYVPGGTGGFIGGVPNAPFNLFATSPLPHSVALQFFDNSINETSFEIDRASFSGNHRGPFSPLATLAAQPGIGPVSFVDTSAISGQIYQYQVRAVDGSVYASDELGSNQITTL